MIDKLITKIKATDAPIVVGLDPMLSYIPNYIKEAAFKEFGETLEGAAEAIWQYNKEIIDKTYDLIPAVKPQIAMYEQFGIPGLVAFKRTVDYCKEKGLVVIGDIKRGDIGSTSAAYAVGHVGRVQVGSKTYVPFDEDFVTVNPYLGSDGVDPFIKVCKEENKGMFILVKTSNPSSGEFQDQSTAQKFVDDNRIRFSLAFGPVLIDDGEIRVPDRYALGEIDGYYSRMALCQRDDLHYLLINATAERAAQRRPLVIEFAKALQGFGCSKAYALDGGQTTVIAMNGQLVTSPDYEAERQISDIIYFATAIPEGG